MKESRSTEWFKKFIAENPNLSPMAILQQAEPSEHAAVAEACAALWHEPTGNNIRAHLTQDEMYDFLRIKQAARARDMIDCARIDSDKFRREGNHQKDRAEKLEPLAADAVKIRTKQATGRSKGAEATKTNAQQRKEAIQAEYLRIKSDNPKWCKDGLQRKIAAIHPRKRGWKLRSIKEATKDL